MGANWARSAASHDAIIAAAWPITDSAVKATQRKPTKIAITTRGRSVRMSSNNPAAPEGGGSFRDAATSAKPPTPAASTTAAASPKAAPGPNAAISAAKAGAQAIPPTAMAAMLTLMATLWRIGPPMPAATMATK